MDTMAIVIDKIQTSGSRQNAYELSKSHVRFVFDRLQSPFITNKIKQKSINRLL